MKMFAVAIILGFASLIGASTVPCICTMDYTPVCGVDGKTYGNKCALDCDGVQLDYQGECHKLCACPRIYMPVCGQNGITYSNQCEMNCAGVAFFQDGVCPASGSSGIQKRAAVPCMCPFSYRPCCGSDGKTYGNECNLKCADTAAGGNKITQVTDGPCPISVP